MCCRYYIDEELPEKLNKTFGYSGWDPTPGDIRPSESAPMLTLDSAGGLNLIPMNWGFTGPDDHLLINARAESVRQKQTFSYSFEKRRLIVPASGFYEWDRNKNRNTFSLDGGGLIFMAGIYRKEESGNRFTIITTDANSTMQPVHDRMPLILSAEQAIEWLKDLDMAALLLKIVPPELIRKPAYEQLSFF